MSADEKYMRLCFELAARAEGRTSPNPLVGAVVVDDDGSIIAEGFHERAGQAHAEVIALDRAGAKAAGKTLYVNLEPCCHFGKTGPCSQRVIASGVKTVIFGTLDPNPKVQGGGLKALQQAGITTRFGILENECRYLNRGFLRWVEHGRPWVCLKMAATIDGRIADRHGASKWITGETARLFVHQLRDKYDCVLVGGATARIDDPQLVVRDVPGARNPFRAVLDTNLSLSPSAKLCRNEDGKTLIFCAAEAKASRCGVFPDHVRLVETPRGKNGNLDLPSVLQLLGEQKMRTVFCEGGSRLAGALLEQSLVDEIVWMIAPKFLLDVDSISAIRAPHTVNVENALTLLSSSMKQVGADYLIQGLLQQP